MEEEEKFRIREMKEYDLVEYCNCIQKFYDLVYYQYTELLIDLPQPELQNSTS